MIGLFKKIRKNLLNKNRVGGYVLYAVGEIILVMIGILLALQVNNWNESRKQRVEEIETLKNIKAEFINSITELKENNVFRNRIMKSTKTLYGHIYENKGHSRDELDSIMADLFMNPTYNGQSETLNILFNSGKINIIRDDSIKNELVKWPQQVEDITEDEVYATNINFNDLQPLIMQYVPLRKIYEKLKFKDLPLFTDTIVSPFYPDYEALFNDRNFEGNLAARELTLSVAYLQTEDLIKTAERIIRLIDEEINDSN
jgi:hypothetical protein